jgi:hypothetical protein
MDVVYKPFRKVHAPIQPDAALALHPGLVAVRNGYLDVLAKYGPGYVAGEISILPPSGIATATPEFMKHFPADAKRPNRLPDHWQDDILVLGGGPGRRDLIWHPAYPESLLIADGDSDCIYHDAFGFADPRFGFLGKECFVGRDHDLVFDSHLHRASMQACLGEGDNVHAREAFGAAMARWFRPGDTIVGDLQGEGDPNLTWMYMHALGGYVKIQGLWPEVEILSVDYDVDEREAVENFLKLFTSRGYTINRWG